MSNVSRIFIALLLAILPVTGMSQALKTDSIRLSVLSLINQYPKATLLDIYKSSFQDRFGPGHIISNRKGAEGYLRKELAKPIDGSYSLYEPTTYQGNYVRVNLIVLKDDVVPFDKFFDAFIRSADQVTTPSMDQWVDEWKTILAVVEDMNLNLPDFEGDKAAIADRLNNGIYWGEHSEDYVKAYDPHYRIISREIFEKEIKPLIEDGYYPCGQLRL